MLASAAKAIYESRIKNKQPPVLSKLEWGHASWGMAICSERSTSINSLSTAHDPALQYAHGGCWHFWPGRGNGQAYWVICLIIADLTTVITTLTMIVIPTSITTCTVTTAATTIRSQYYFIKLLLLVLLDIKHGNTCHMVTGPTAVAPPSPACAAGR